MPEQNDDKPQALPVVTAFQETVKPAVVTFGVITSAIALQRARADASNDWYRCSHDTCNMYSEPMKPFRTHLLNAFRNRWILDASARFAAYPALAIFGYNLYHAYKTQAQIQAERDALVGTDRSETPQEQTTESPLLVEAFKRTILPTVFGATGAFAREVYDHAKEAERKSWGCNSRVPLRPFKDHLYRSVLPALNTAGKLVRPVALFSGVVFGLNILNLGYQSTKQSKEQALDEDGLIVTLREEIGAYQKSQFNGHVERHRNEQTNNSPAVVR